MSEFAENRSLYKDHSMRGTYLIIPVKESQGKGFEPQELTKLPFTDDELSDKSGIINERCCSNYLLRYKQSDGVKPYKFVFLDGSGKREIVFSNLQLYLFENGIGFLTLFAVYHNKDISQVYNLVNNGYIGDQGKTNAYERLYDEISTVINPSNLEIFIKENQKNILLNDSYIFNFAIVGKRFRDLETIDKLTLNIHKQIDLSADFIDNSETDLHYVYGARDVEKRTYRWGCCVSTLDISYVYQSNILSDNSENYEEIYNEMMKVSAGDLLLTMFALIQKYTCTQFNEELYSKLHERDISDKNRRNAMRNAQELKQKMLEFRAFGTLAPSQMSRWNNVCETYGSLLDAMGTEEALDEVEEKINLLNSEQERHNDNLQNRLSLFIAVFGIISIIESIISIVDLIVSGSVTAPWTLAISTAAVLIFCISWFIKSQKG